MKTLVLALTISTFMGYHMTAQKLSDFYKKDVITLEPVSDFGSKKNWDNLFSDYSTFEYGKPIGQMRSIIVAPDGSIFMSHKTRHEIWKFDKNGNFLLKFGQQGGKPGQFLYLPTVQGILDGKYIYTSDVQGRLNFFDFNGNFVKMLKLDYMPLGTVPLKNGKIAIIGHVGGKVAYVIQIKDFNTGAEKQLVSEPAEINKTSVKIDFPKGGGISFFVPITHAPQTFPRLASAKNGNLILASPKTGKIMEYSPDSQLINSFAMNIEPVKVTNEDIQKTHDEIEKGAENFMKNSPGGKKMTEQEREKVRKELQEQLERLKDPANYPKYLPYFSTMVVDSDGNILIFEYTRDEDKLSNKFRAYSYDMKGNLLGVSSFKNDALDLTFTPQNFQFYNGYVYSIAQTKQKTTEPLKIVKLKLQ